MRRQTTPTLTHPFTALGRYALAAITGGVLVLVAASPVSHRRDRPSPPPPPATMQVGGLTVASMLAMPDAELAGVDPLLMNLAVARGVPEYAKMDAARYTAAVDDWAAAIDAANRRDEPGAADDPAYRHDRRVWLAGGMAAGLARAGVRYTSAPLDPSRPEQQFVCGVIDSHTGTCATMPVLYMAVARRLGWPVHAVVSKDHMWARWDDSVPAERGGIRFNIEATSAGADGAFATPPDEEYIARLGTPRIALVSGSDLTTLTPRQTLGVFLQGRAGYWAAKNEWARAEQDLLRAVECFPQNREIRTFLAVAMRRVGERVFTPAELARLAWTPVGGRVRSPFDPPASTMPGLRSISTVQAEAERLNREAAERQRLRSGDPGTAPAPKPDTEPTTNPGNPTAKGG